MTRSEELFERAVKVLPGGVNSPVRAFRAVGGNPRFVVKGLGQPHPGTRTGWSISTISARGGRWCWATAIRIS